MGCSSHLLPLVRASPFDLPPPPWEDRVDLVPRTDLVHCPADDAEEEEGTLAWDPNPAQTSAALRLVALLAMFFVLGCGRDRAPDPAAAPGVAWEGSWPVLVLGDPAVSEHLEPLDAHAATWLTPPDHAGAAGWMDPAEVAGAFAGEGPSARIGRARALNLNARALDALATLDARALCDLGQRPESYGDQVPEGYLFGVEGCLWAGDAEGAARAWQSWGELGAGAAEDLSGWPPPPEGPLEPGTRRELPVSGFDPSTGRPFVAHARVYRSRGQEVEYAFVLPADLAAAGEVLRRAGAESLDGCEECPAGTGDWLARPRRAPAALCAIEPHAALPLLIGSGAMRVDHACAGGDDHPPTYTAGADLAALDEALAGYVTRFVSSVEQGAVPGGALPREALPTLRAMVERALAREVGLDAFAAGDGAVALWALEVASGPSEAPRGARDPELLCTLSLARYQAGTYRPVIRALEGAASLPGWEILGPVARSVARVEALPGAGVHGVMR